MAQNIQGNFTARAVKAELGRNKKGLPEFKVEMEIVGGEHAGRKLPYSGLFTEKAVKYTRSALVELGWSGKDIATAPADVLKAAKVVPIEVTIANWTNPDTGELREWSTVRNIGTYSAPLEPLTPSDFKDVNSWLADAGGGSDSIPF